MGGLCGGVAIIGLTVSILLLIRTYPAGIHNSANNCSLAVDKGPWPKSRAGAIACSLAFMSNVPCFVLFGFCLFF